MNAQVYLPKYFAFPTIAQNCDPLNLKDLEVEFAFFNEYLCLYKSFEKEISERAVLDIGCTNLQEVLNEELTYV